MSVYKHFTHFSEGSNLLVSSIVSCIFDHIGNYPSAGGLKNNSEIFKKSLAEKIKTQS